MSPARRVYRAALRAVQRLVNALGWNVALAADYYSPLPLRSELARHRARWDRPSELVGVRYDLDAMRSLDSRLFGEHGAELRDLTSYDDAKRLGYGPGFTRLDAQWLYLMLRHLKPARYVEVGSGLSTWYASVAGARNATEGRPCKLAAIDPYASEQVRGIAGLEVVREPVQSADLGPFLALDAGDVLFIDSTHVVKIDGDVPHLYLEVLPRLRPGVVVHSHDVHFPYNTPHPAETYVLEAKWPRYWTEAMLLQAFLCGNESWEILLSAGLLRHFDEDHLRATVPDYRPLEIRDHDTHYGSIWYQRQK
ncbi:MAG TPA: class I SAM-dependent methyltransferase [Thermoanaerobaculia bacterium]|nr:class I SAM-dependent methyltransferase [Thermoanaerobaculia bacterium]